MLTTSSQVLLEKSTGFSVDEPDISFFTMNRTSVNEFLPASHLPPQMGETEDDEIDVARFSAMKRQQKDELDHLEHRHQAKQHEIEKQVAAELDKLFTHFQTGMQTLYTALHQTVNTTIDSQVKLRMQQERLKDEYAAQKRDAERRFHNDVSQLVMSTSQTRPVPGFLRAPNSTLPVGSPGVPTPNGDRKVSPAGHASPAAAPAARTPPVRRQVMSRPAPINPVPREFAVHEPHPYPTPQEPVQPHRKPVPSEPRSVEHRPTESHYFEPHPVEQRPSEQRPVEPRPIEPRPVEQRPVEPRSVEPRTVGQRTVEQRAVEHRQIEQRPLERRQVESRSVEQPPVEPRQMEQHRTGQPAVERRPAEQRPLEPRPEPPMNESRLAELSSAAEFRHAEARQAESRAAQPRHVEMRPVEPRENRHIEPRPAAQPVESTPLQHMVARPIHEETPSTKPQQSAAPQDPRLNGNNEERALKGSTTKRKAVESPQVDIGVASSKRPRTRDRLLDQAQDVPQSPVKRSPRARRSSQIGSQMRVERTIPFAELYQDGKAQFKHKIIEYKTGSGNWYIVRCDDHQVHFGFKNPVHGAAKHVHSPQHGNLEKKHDLAIEICGHRILDCNAELAELNNLEFERAVKEDKYQVFNMNLLTKEGRRRLTDGPQKDPPIDSSPTAAPSKIRPKLPPLQPRGDPVDHPRDCGFYEGFWQPTKQWYMLIVLPIRSDGSLREVGLKEKLQETGVMDKVPKCYRVDRVSLQVKGWQPAYMDGGPKATKREYPVMFFDNHQRCSVGWVCAEKLRPIDLDNPPDGTKKRGLALARDWFAKHMMHRKDWEDWKKLGPGEPPSSSSSASSPEWPSLRSAHTDEQSPIRDKSSGPGFGFGSSSEEASDDDDPDPMTMDIGPIPEAEDSNYVGAESGPDDSDVEMEETEEDVNDVIRPSRRTSQTSSFRPGSRREPAMESEKDDMEVTVAADQLDGGPPTPPTTDGGDQRDPPAADQTYLRKSAQAQAVAAVKEAASRSRASSEVPQNAHNMVREPGHSSRPPFADHSRSRSEDTSRAHGEGSLATQVNKLKEARMLWDLQGNVNTEQVVPRPESAGEDDPYKRFEAIKAQMNGLRSASAPVHEGSGTDSPFPPPPAPSALGKTASAQQSPSVPLMMSPRSQSTTSTPVQQSERGTPKIVIPGNSDRWQALRQMETPHASFVSMAPLSTTSSSQLHAPTPQLGTPIPDKGEFFDVSQFRDSARGMRWCRDGPSTSFLRLNTDPMRGWAETVGNSPLTAHIEPSKIARIDMGMPRGNQQKVQLMLKDGHEQMVVFEDNSTSGRKQTGALQARRFVSWVKKVNEKAQLHRYVSKSWSRHMMSSC